jgi:hypothetical protein
MTGPADTPNEGAPQAQPVSPLLKVLVIGMGVLIVVMSGLLVLGLALGWNKKAPPANALDPLAATSTQIGQVSALEIPTAAGSRLYTLAGDGARIALHIAAPTGDEIIIIDTSKNRILSRIRLIPGGEPAVPKASP